MACSDAYSPTAALARRSTAPARGASASSIQANTTTNTHNVAAQPRPTTMLPQSTTEPGRGRRLQRLVMPSHEPEYHVLSSIRRLPRVADRFRPLREDHAASHPLTKHSSENATQRRLIPTTKTDSVRVSNCGAGSKAPARGASALPSKRTRPQPSITLAISRGRSPSAAWPGWTDRIYSNVSAPPSGETLYESLQLRRNAWTP